MANVPDGRRGDTMQQLKDDIDSGRTGAKTAVSDPGMASLGTCDEAGGATATPEQIAMARKEEKKIGRIATQDDKPATNIPLMAMIGVAVVVAIVAIAFFLTR
jgi:hypothetical protein